MEVAKVKCRPGSGALTLMSRVLVRRGTSGLTPQPLPAPVPHTCTRKRSCEDTVGGQLSEAKEGVLTTHQAGCHLDVGLQPAEFPLFKHPVLVFVTAA